MFNLISTLDRVANSIKRIDSIREPVSRSFLYEKVRLFQLQILSFRLSMRPWIAVNCSATAVFIIYLLGQKLFSDEMPLVISVTLNFMIVFQAE